MKTLVRLAPFARKYWRWLVLAFFCLLGNIGFGLAVPWIIRRAIDSALSGGQTSFLILAAFAGLIFSILRGIAAYGNNYLSEVVSQKTAYDIRNALYDRLQRLSFAYHDKSQTGDLMSRATADVEAVRMFFGRGMLGVAQVAVLSFAIGYILLSMNWQLALLTLLFIPLIGIRTITVSLRLQKIWLKVQQMRGTMGTTLEENLTAARVVRAFSRENAESNQFSSQANQLYNQQIAAARQTAFNMPLMVFLVSMPTVVILWYGGRQVIEGNLTIGALTQFMLYVGMLAMPVRRLGFITNMLSRTTSAGQRIFEILDAKSAVEEKPNAVELKQATGRVSFENVGFSYDSTAPALEKVSFTAEPGQVVALLGGSGCGKTTIANLIPRFYDVTSGGINIDGMDIRDMTLASLRWNVGIVQQDVFLFSATIRDNIAYGAVNATNEQIIAASKAANLHDFIQSLPDGYNTWVGERGLTLSGGEKQRLSIARTILLNPKILILDDSTSSVDTNTEQQILAALDQLMKARTTFVITHRLTVIKNADLILMLQQGRIMEQGTHEQLMEKRGLYRQLYESQLGAVELSRQPRGGAKL
ncbi:MAG: ABC transporter ATP-binding protein [Chloroflexi bacterium]|nr:ABC transporter ATP-binding protein [Chloroflexota bacterium]